MIDEPRALIEIHEIHEQLFEETKHELGGIGWSNPYALYGDDPTVWIA